MPGNDIPPQVRAFVAAPLPADLIEVLSQVPERVLRQFETNAVRWVRVDQIHLTIQFFGDVPANELASVGTGLRNAVRELSPIPLGLGKLGCFPTARRPNVIWIGVTGDLNALRALQERVARATEGVGSHSEERVFQPHVTLGRVRAFGAEAQRIGELVESAVVEAPGSWRVTELHLVKSQLTPRGSVYEILQVIPLEGAAG